MPFIHSVECSFPDNYYTQNEILNELGKVWKKHFKNFERIEEIQKNSQVEHRHLCLPLESYLHLKGLKQKNDFWIKHALELSFKAVSNLLNKSNINPAEIKLLVSSTVTGFSVPTIEAKLMNLLPFDSGTKRLPIFGLGCLAGVAGLNRTIDYLKGHPKEAAIFFTTELCSLTFQFEDFSIPNVISTALFGDGCAAVLLLGDDHPFASKAKIKLLKGYSKFFPKTENIMGWEYIDTGAKVVLNAEVPTIVKNFIPSFLASALDDTKLTLNEIKYILSHPGGPKVLESLADTLNLQKSDLNFSWESLRNKGNMSSVSVLYILSEFLKSKYDKNKAGMMLALGPAFCAELTLFKTVD
ncbi:MAG: hypothetical protein U0T83_06715 [Bacteriovoracaceae bacterium]